jgi:signal transduction histidine kinase
VTLLIDELAPVRRQERSRAQEAERAKLAADLHAYVLPDLRRAASAVASGDAPDSVRTTVGRALEEVERLMQGRQSIVLEEFGLVAALEWLAERTEQAGALRVELELEGPGVEARDAVPAGIARAAFRIALLAVDNVARHAVASVATIRLSVDRERIVLAVSDDGDGNANGAGAPPSAGRGRGLTDMATEATSTGGSLATTPPPRATVVATWPARPSGRTA